MKVLVAKTAGFCMGVQRALDLVLDTGSRGGTAKRGSRGAAGDEELHTLGPLIHNEQALEALQARGVHTAASLDDVTGSSVVVRAHGAGPTLRKEIGERDLDIIDATCPRVTRCQRAVERAAGAGRQVIIAGDHDHAEVTALVDFTGNRASVITSVEEATGIELDPPVTLVAQTTFNSRTYGEIAATLASRLSEGNPDDLETVQSLCRSTEDRQKETIDLAAAVDAVVVVGGKHSANTKRLAEVARDHGRPAYHVETADELDPEAFTSYSIVGVTAGASTPAWVTERVVDRLKEFGSPLRRAARRLSVALMGANVLLAAGAASVAVATSLVSSRPPSAGMLFIAFAYVLFAYSANREGDLAHPVSALTARVGFFLRYRRPIMALSILLTVAALATAFSLTPATGIALLVASMFAGLYSLRVLPLGIIQLHRPRDIPGSKDLMIALAWVFVAVALPLIPGLAGSGGGTVAGTFLAGPALLVAGAVFALSFAASTALSLGDVQSDRLIGRETVAMLVGRGPARAIAAGCAGAVAFGTGLPAVMGWIPVAGLGFAFAGLMVLVATLSRRRTGDSLRFGLGVQFSLMAAGPVGMLAEGLTRF